MRHPCPLTLYSLQIRHKMKAKITLVLLTLSLYACHKTTDAGNDSFAAEKISKTASFIVDANIEQVFPLFGAFEERKWEPSWEPILIYPDEEMIEEGTTFKIKAHGHGHGPGNESEYLWIVTKFDPQSHLIQYLVSTPNRFWTITVHCENMVSDEKTKATVTYSFTGLNTQGNELNKTSLDRMYRNDLQDWAEAINTYLGTL